MAGQLPYSLDPLQQALAQAAAAASLTGHGNLNPQSQTQTQTQTQHQHQQQHQIHPPPHHQHPNPHSFHLQHLMQHLPPSPSSASTSKRDAGAGASVADQRLPQWTYQETTDFIAIRAALEDDFVHTKRNKTLWETVSARMKEKGYNRSAEQCKCKWKNLVMRYKEKDAMEADDGRQCPFYDELHAVFADQRDRKADRLSADSDMKPKKKTRSHGEDYSDEENGMEYIDESEGEQAAARFNKKRKTERQKASVEKCRVNRMQEVLEEFFEKYARMEMMWREHLDRREEQRRIREQEFRQAMEKLEAERMAKEQQWREREEQRRIREEARAEKRDALLTAILHRLSSRNDNL